MRTAELSTEQNYNMIDGQINNTRPWTSWKKGKARQAISLSALARLSQRLRTAEHQRDRTAKSHLSAHSSKRIVPRSCKPQQRKKNRKPNRSIRRALEME